MILLPPSHLFSQMSSELFQRKFLLGLPELEVTAASSCSRRTFVRAAGAALALFAARESSAKQTSWERSPALMFSPDDNVSLPNSSASPVVSQPTAQAMQDPRLARGIPPDFWYRPRQLWLKRSPTGEEIRITYWQDGAIIPEGYWRACALLRDVRANKMTTMDPVVLDILAGVQGYYQAWNWPHPVVILSGFRTLETNNALAKEGAAKNSMHLYGKGADLFIPGIPARDVGILGQHLQQGGVGFYPSRGFTHLDTGRLRVWQG
jgi:uncharacterized protein YcbK (DUF882 family)